MKILFKIFRFIFGWKSQVEFTKSKYSQNLGERIGATVVLFLFVAATLALEFWMISAFKDNAIVGILALIFLCAVGGATLKLLALYSAVAFAAAREAKKFAVIDQPQETPDTPKQEVVSNDPLANTEEQQQEQPVEKPIKSYRKFDITMGFVFMTVAVCLFATLILIPVLELKAAAK